MNLIELKCKTCGAPLTLDGRCEYCGARYIVQNEILVRTAPCALIPLAVETQVSGYYARSGEQAAAEYALSEMRYQLADALTGALKITTRRDYYRDLIIIRGQVRVAPPDFHF